MSPRGSAGPPPRGAGVVDAGGRAEVTVMSVPIPYSECSTALWAFATPVEAAVTVTTTPIPRAMPAAVRKAGLGRRRSSRARYVTRNTSAAQSAHGLVGSVALEEQ